MRTLTPAAAAAVASNNFEAAMLVEMLFDDPIRVTTEGVDVDWNGHTWSGVGELVGEVGAVNDAAGNSEALRFSLSAVPAVVIALALEETARDKACRLYFAIMNPTNLAILDAPMIWAGMLDQMPISDGAQSASIGVTAKHIGSLFSRVKKVSYTAKDQRRLYPEDTSLRFVTSQAAHKDIWPAASWGKQ